MKILIAIVLISMTLSAAEQNTTDLLKFLPKTQSRNIKQLFQVGVGYGINSIKIDRYEDIGLAAEGQHLKAPVANFGVQVLDNWWAEVAYSTATIDRLPLPASQTLLEVYTIKIKYDTILPFMELHLQPYISYRSVKSENNVFGTPNMTEEQKRFEAEQINKIEENKFFLGASLIKIFNNGFFAQGNLGNDIISLSTGLYY